MYQYKAKLIKVVDGDTVDALIDCGFSTFKKERVRLYGINAPESRTRDKKEKKRGLASKARLKELIKEGKNEFIVETMIDKKGKYGRLLGELFNPSGVGTSYNKTLVKKATQQNTLEDQDEILFRNRIGGL